MEPIKLNACDGTTRSELCRHTCKPGYSGGSITCLGNSSYTVVACISNDSQDAGSGASEDASSIYIILTIAGGSVVLGILAAIIIRRRNNQQKVGNKPKLNSVVPITDNLDGNIPTEAEKVKNRAEKAWLVDEKV
jgi:hypothetical protein